MTGLILSLNFGVVGSDWVHTADGLVIWRWKPTNSHYVVSDVVTNDIWFREAGEA